MHFLKKLFHIFEALVAEIIFGFPSSKIKVIAVTGTDGKTTTTHLLCHLLQSSGYKVGMISSIYANTGDKTYDTGFHTTTPRPFAVRSYLKQALSSKCDYFILEVTSHAIDQGRTWGIPYMSGVITNVTHEHLYHHNSFEKYLNIKTKLLLQSKQAYVNYDMKAFKMVKNQLKKHNKHFFTYSLKKREADFTWPKQLKTTLKGEYNKQNVMAAYAVVTDLGLTQKDVQNGLNTFQLPKGRFDVVYNKKFSIIVDFAHTPNSLNQVLSTVRHDYGGGSRSLVHVFGAASERDDSKRPLMGEASAYYADKIILTEEDYRKENIHQIFSQLEKGILRKGFTYLEPKDFIAKNSKKTYTKIANRGHAIDAAISILAQNDTLITTGKSHEKSLNRNGVEEPWDEYGAIKESLMKHYSIKL